MTVGVPPAREAEAGWALDRPTDQAAAVHLTVGASVQRSDHCLPAAVVEELVVHGLVIPTS